ncbi:MAG: 2-phospho-L-lactate transferase [Deinococcus sp.]|nr:2-phospho-L-lactate transferase [Deinococcus sp.]
MIVALSGGVGGAKLSWGLERSLANEELAVIVNTGDDFILHGLYIAPDLDTVMYTLADLANPATGWGIANDTFHALAMLERYGQPVWFQLGDRDLAIHLARTNLLRQQRLTEVTATLAQALGVRSRILPMSDQRVETRILTPDGELAFQDYFVRRRQQDLVHGVRFQGAEQATLSPEVLAALAQARLIVFCPSNPIISIGPILAVPEMHAAIASAQARKVAVSPIIAGQAVKGPLVAMMQGLGLEPSAPGVARLYADLVDSFILDQQDAHLAPQIAALGLKVTATNTLMSDHSRRRHLAEVVLAQA